MRTALILATLCGLGPAAAAHEPLAPCPQLGLGGGVEIADGEVAPAVLARVAWGRLALEPSLALSLASSTVDETATGYDAHGEGAARAGVVTIGLRVELARRGRVAVGLLGRAGAGYAWAEDEGPGPSDDVATRTTRVAVGGGVRLEWAALGPLVVLVDVTTDLAAWSREEREGSGLLTEASGWTLGVDAPGTLRALALVTF